MKKLSNMDLDDLQFDAQLMGFRVVYLEKPLDWNHFVLYHLMPQLTYVGHYRTLNDVRMDMQQHYVPAGV
jgi:hypothetical protein